MTIFIYELNFMTQEQWIIDENRRLDQEILDQQNDNEIRRQVNHQSLLTSKKNAKAYSG